MSNVHDTDERFGLFDSNEGPDPKETDPKETDPNEGTEDPSTIGGAPPRNQPRQNRVGQIQQKQDAVQKKNDDLLYVRSVVETKVVLFPEQVFTGNTDVNIVRMVASTLEGRCNADGYVQPGSVELVGKSAGKATPKGTIEFVAVVAYNACCPTHGTVLHRACKCVSVTKAGIHATITDSHGNVPANVFIHRELSANDPAFSEVQVGDVFSVRVMYVRNELNDKTVTIGGMLVSLGGPQAPDSGANVKDQISIDAVLLRRTLNIEALKDELAAAVGNRSEVERAAKHKDYIAVYTLKTDKASYITRAIQEIPILSTKMTKMLKGKSHVFPSFMDVWNESEAFRTAVEQAPDVAEAKWALARQFGYQMITTFMPPYAMQIYKHFGAKRVLDPCGGWGDRLLGAVVLGRDTHRFDPTVLPSADRTVEKYVCFDPNPDVRAGYAEIMRLFAIQPVDTSITSEHMQFENGFEVYTQPFEVGAASLQDESFDLVSTSPPFFSLEIYNEANPTYTDWFEFYRQLFRQSERCVVKGGHVCIHIDNTSAGEIEPFLRETVEQITQLKFLGRIGLTGVMSSKVRSVWVYQK